MKMQVLLAAGILGALSLALTQEARAHGGQYRGPADVVPPQLGSPGDQTPPPVPGGPPTPSGNDPTSPTTPGVGPPTAPSTPTVTGPGATTRRSRGGAEGFEQWSFWWENNKDRFLRVRDRIYGGGILTGDIGYHLGKGKREQRSLPFQPTLEQINEQVLPALKVALADRDFDTRAAALIGLGKAGRDGSVIEDIQKGFDDDNVQVRESASLALGLLGQPEAIPHLIDLLNDTPAGRKLVQRPTGVEARTRAFAAIGLGLIGETGLPGEQQALPELLKVVRRADGYGRDDVPAAAIHALGLLGDENAVPDLEAVLGNARLSDYVRAAAPIALGKIGDPSAVAILERFLRNDRASDLVRWSALIGYGRLLRGSQQEEAVRLLSVLLKDGDAQTRNFATMSIAYIGGPTARNTLLGAYRTARPEQRPWISLSLGVYGWRQDRDDAIVEQVRRQFQEQRNPSWKAGHAIALGLLGDRGSADLLTRELAKSRDSELRGYLCVALGLMEATEAQQQLQQVLKISRSFPKLQQQAAIGLGLMGDKGVVGLLSDIMEGTDSAYVLGSTAIALGLIGDRDAIDPLVRISSDEEAKKIARALATVGLGIVADKDRLPQLSRLAEDNNYRAKLDFMAELLTIL